MSKMHKKFPGSNFDEPTIPSEGTWIDCKSRGGLVFPSISLWNKLNKFSVNFNEFHGPKINMEPRPIERLLTILISEHRLNEPCDLFAAKLYVNVRFFNRIKILNEEIKAEENAQKMRRRKQEGQFMY